MPLVDDTQGIIQAIATHALKNQFHTHFLNDEVRLAAVALPSAQLTCGRWNSNIVSCACMRLLSPSCFNWTFVTVIDDDGDHTPERDEEAHRRARCVRLFITIAVFLHAFRVIINNNLLFERGGGDFILENHVGDFTRIKPVRIVPTVMTRY